MATIKDPTAVVFQEGILFRIDSSCWWGKSSRMDIKELGEDIDEDIISGVKVLVDPNSLAGLRSFKSYGERVVKKRDYPFLGLRGVYYVPKAFISGVDEELWEAKEMFDKEKKSFLRNFGKYKTEWKKKSGKYYDDKLYPTVPQLEDRFFFDWSKFIVSLPGSDMGILTDKEYKEELKKQKARMIEFLDSTLEILASKFFLVLSNLETKLKSGDPIKPKTISALRSFIETFDGMNVTNNAQLSALVDKANKTIGATGAKDFNQDEKLTKQISKKIGTLVKEFQTTANKDERFQRALDF